MSRLMLPAIVVALCTFPSVSNAEDEGRLFPRIFGRAAAIITDQVLNNPLDVQVKTNTNSGDKRSSVNVSVKTRPNSQSETPTVTRKVQVNVSGSQAVQPTPTQAPIVHHVPAPIVHHVPVMTRHTLYPCYPRRVFYVR